jgi:hypothetical protein
MTTVNVTQEDIDTGTAGSCSECPVALAVTYALGLGERDSVRVTASSIYVYPTGSRFRSPPSVKKFIKDFDSPLNLSVEPFSFELVEDGAGE